MKKIFKKSIACLIAVLMVVSVMPLTMPLTTPVSVEAADVSSIQSFTFDKAVASGKGYHYGNVATGGYDNILYCSKDTIVENDFTGVGDNGEFKTFSPNVVVMMYDGSTAGFPITVECRGAGGCKKTYYLRYILWNGDSRFSFDHPWYGYIESAWQSWPNKNSTNSTLNIPVTSSSKNIELSNATSRFFNNEVYYKGTGNSTDYYESISGTKVQIDVNGNKGTKSTNSSIYVLDYNSFYSKVETVKSIQKNLVDYPNRYTTTSSEQAINAITAYNAANERVKTAFDSVNDSNAASTVQSVAADMKAAVALIDAVNLVCAHTQTRVEGAQEATCATAGKSGTVYCRYCGTLMENSYDIPATGKHNYTNKVSDEVPANCTTTGTTAVMQCANCDARTGGDVIPVDSNNHTGLTTIPAVEATCTSTGLTEGQKCTACGVTTIEQQTVEMKAHDWGDWVYDADKKEKRTCKDCGTVDSEKRACEYVEKPGTPATCIAEGKRVYRCTQCGNEYEEILPVDSEAHSTATRVETTNATCTTAGKKETVTYCTLCNKEISREKTEDIPALEHDFTVFEQLNADKHTVKCSRKCGEEGWTYTEAHTMDGNTCSKCGYIAKVTITFVDENDEIIRSDEYNIGAVVAVPDLPVQTAVYADNSQHTLTIYSWDGTPQTTASEAATYKRVKTETTEACSNELKKRGETSDTWYCTVCKHEYERAVAKMTDLNDAIVELEALVNADDASYKYEASALETAKKAVINAKNYASSNRYATKEEVDAEIAKVLSAETELTENGLAQYTVTFALVDGDTGETIEPDSPVSKKYGEVAEKSYTFNKDEEGFPEYVVCKWTKKVLNSKGKWVETTLNSTTNDMSVVVKETATYTCYVLKFKASTDVEGVPTTTRVRYLDKSGKTLKIDYATIGENYVAQETSIAPLIPYYKCTGWERVFGEDTPVGTRELVYRAIYDFNETEANRCTIVGLNGVYVNGTTGTPGYTAYYDEKIELKGADKYAYAKADGSIIAPINESYIFAPHLNGVYKTIYVTKVETPVENATSIITGTFTTKDDPTYNYLVVNAQFYLPEGATAVESGVVIGKQNDANVLKIGSATKVVSTSQGDNHEYSIQMSYSKGKSGTLYARSYLIYVDGNGDTQTVYSDDITTCILD